MQGLLERGTYLPLRQPFPRRIPKLRGCIRAKSYRKIYNIVTIIVKSRYMRCFVDFGMQTYVLMAYRSGSRIQVKKLERLAAPLLSAKPILPQESRKLDIAHPSSGAGFWTRTGTVGEHRKRGTEYLPLGIIREVRKRW